MFSILLITSCSCVRIFSKLNIVKSKFRSTTVQDCLESLILLFSEQEMAYNVEVDLVVNEFNVFKYKEHVVIDL